jgi:hypothetical protein
MDTPRLASANNVQVPEDMRTDNKEESRIDFLDFNGLYTSTMMSERLPAYAFCFLSDSEIDSIDFLSVPEDADKGFILEVDMTYEKGLHELHDVKK